MSLAERLLGRWFQPLVDRTVREKLAVIEDDNSFLVGARRLDDSPRDRLNLIGRLCWKPVWMPGGAIRWPGGWWS